MSIPVLLFASFADAFGTRELLVPVDTPCMVDAIVDAMRSMPGGDMLPTRPVVAVNQRLADPAVPVVTGDEVALIPPVAGG